MLNRNRGFKLGIFAVCMLIAVCGFLLFGRLQKRTAEDKKMMQKEIGSEESQSIEKFSEEAASDNGQSEDTKNNPADAEGDAQESVSADQENTESDSASTAKTDSEKSNVTEEQLIVLQNPTMYTYEDLENDVWVLSQLYPEIVRSDSLGTTPDGRELYHFVIGDPEAENRIFISAGIHAREYITCQLVMKQAAVFLGNLTADAVYGDCTYRELMEGSAIHVVPMINPDGISISQFGLKGIQTEAVLEQVKNIAQMDGQKAEGTYLTRWKSNANGVDLNRNFDAMWEQYNDGKGHPSSDHYKGTEPGSEPEAAALIRLTEEENFSRTISYHTQGGVIYWYFGQEGELYEKTKRFAERIGVATGYYPEANYENLDPAGYKDWAVSKCGIPSLTIEVGRETSPVPSDQMEEIWLRNDTVWEETLIDSRL